MAESEDGQHRAAATVSGGDPGYDETAKMAAETAVEILLGRLGGAEMAGVMTPAVAGGHNLIRRLRNAGMKFDMLPPPK